jgi:nicotinic acid mononucleotide adenylyltransferase
MELLRRGSGGARLVALLAGAWNPPTRAHVALAEAALEFAPEVLLALPGVLPHKEFEEAGFDTRLGWLLKLAAGRDWLGVAAGGSGLFVDLARGLRAADPKVEQIFIVCGSDAAERFLNWDYGARAGVKEQLREFTLLVAPRGAPFVPPQRLKAAVQPLNLAADWQTLSSTELRQRIKEGKPWAHLAPQEIAAEIQREYR